MKLKELLSKEFFVYIILKLISILLMSISLFYLFFSNKKDVFLGILLFIIGLIFLLLVSLKDKPKLVTCLNKSNFFVSFFVNTSLYLCIVMIGLFFTFDFKETLFDEKIFFIVLIVIFVTSVFAYMYCCKKNKILNQKEK